MEDDGSILIQKIDQIRRKTGFDETFVKASTFHFRQYNNFKTSTCQDVCDLLMTKLFIDKMDNIYPAKRFQCKVTEDSNWPVQLCPVECFGATALPDNYRLNRFYTCLKISDVLDCRVATVDPFDYQLRVIHKYGTTSILDDLNITVIMPKSKPIDLILKKELLSCELIRVKVNKISEKDGKVFVTVEEDCEAEELRKLGRLPEGFLPPYVLDPHHVAQQCTSYSRYLSRRFQFKNPILLNDINADFGIDPHMVYSFYPEFDGSKCDESKTGQALLKESKLHDARKYALEATSASKEKNFSEAINCINKAIDLCPQKDEMVYSLYDIRGTIHCASKTPKVSREALSDWIKAYTLNPKDEDVKKNLSMYLFKIANKSYRKKEYKNAFREAEKALEFDKHNDEDHALIEYLKKKHSEIFLDQESLIALQEKQMALVTQLKNVEETKYISSLSKIRRCCNY